MKKQMSLLFCSVLLCLIASGCSKTAKAPDAAACLADMNAGGGALSYVQFSNVEIARQQVFEEDKAATIDVTFTGSDSYAEYQGSATLRYNYYDDSGWMLDEVVYGDISYYCTSPQSEDEISSNLVANRQTYVGGNGTSFHSGDDYYAGDCSDIQFVSCALSSTDSNIELVEVNWESTLGNVRGMYSGTLAFAYTDGAWGYVGVVDSAISDVDLFDLEGDWYYDDRKITIDSITAEELVITINGVFDTYICEGDNYSHALEGTATYTNGDKTCYFFNLTAPEQIRKYYPFFNFGGFGGNYKQR